MTHPTRETWMSYLYDEMSAEERTAQRRHLDSCAECRTQLTQWQSAADRLDEWKLPARRRALRRVAFVRWAAAAAFVGLAVLGGARLSALTNEVKELRAEVQRNVGLETDALAQVSDHAAKSATMEAQALVAAVAQQWEQKRVLDQQATVAALQQLSTRHTQDYAAMRKELETVAVFSEAGWQRTQNQISSLADTTASIPNDK